MGFSFVGFSFVFRWNSDVDHDSVEGLFSMSLLPRKHSPDNPPDIVVRPSRMSWGFFLVAERSRFQFCLGPGDNSRLCPCNNGTFSVQPDHLLPSEGLL